jgi:hypothetical protein
VNCPDFPAKRERLTKALDLKRLLAFLIAAQLQKHRQGASSLRFFEHHWLWTQLPTMIASRQLPAI